MITSYLGKYLRITQAKIIVWGFFLIPYVLVIIFYSGVLPPWVQSQIQWHLYSSSLALWKLFPTPIPKVGAAQAMPSNTDPELLTVGYFLVTYLWSCILVENFGTISLCLHHRVQKRGSRGGSLRRKTNGK